MASVTGKGKWIQIEYINNHGFVDTIDRRIDTEEQRYHARRLLAEYDQIAAQVWHGEPGYPDSYKSAATFR